MIFSFTRHLLFFNDNFPYGTVSRSDHRDTHTGLNNENKKSRNNEIMMVKTYIMSCFHHRTFGFSLSWYRSFVILTFRYCTIDFSFSYYHVFTIVVPLFRLFYIAHWRFLYHTNVFPPSHYCVFTIILSRFHSRRNISHFYK